MFLYGGVNTGKSIEFSSGGLNDISVTLLSNQTMASVCVEDWQALRPVRTEEEKARRHREGDTGAKFQSKQFEAREDGISSTITTITKDNLIMAKRIRIRKLTPRECGRLMGVSDADIDKIQQAGISDSQQYKMYGNSIVVDTLVNGIFKPLFAREETQEELTLF